MKHCRKCGKDISSRPGKTHYCKDCAVVVAKVKNRQRAARYREKHQEEVKVINAQWNLKHPERRKEISQKYRAVHSVEVYERTKNWRMNNPEKYKELCRQGNIKKQKDKQKQRRRFERVPPCEGKNNIPRSGELLVAAECIDCNTIILAGLYGRKWYCETCVLERRKKNATEARERHKAKNPVYNTVYVRLRRNNGEVVVGGECIRCHCFVLFAERGKHKQRCDACAAFVEKRADIRRHWENKKRDTPVEEFIASEKRRLRLDQPKEKWTPQRINWEFMVHDKRQRHDELGVLEE